MVCGNLKACPMSSQRNRVGNSIKDARAFLFFRDSLRSWLFACQTPKVIPSSAFFSAPVAERRGCAPALKGAIVTQNQTFLAFSTDRRSTRRRGMSACNDNSGGGGYCPLCHQATTAPIASDYRGQGTVHHRWLCAGCGHNWVTSSHVLY
jgi:hypothetical protein